MYYFSGILFCILALNCKCFAEDSLTWCVVSAPEYKKCQRLAESISRDTVIKNSRTYSQFYCIQRLNHEECMKLIEEDKADIVTLDPNEIFSAGRYHSLVPIMQEAYIDNIEYVHSIAVIKRNGSLTGINTLHDLYKSKACFPSVSSMAGWIIPISKLIELKIIQVIDCNNYIKSASAFFGSSCAVNVLADIHNPLGDNDQTLCEICGSHAPGIYCTNEDRFSGYHGAVDCLIESGDIAFIKHSTLSQVLEYRASKGEHIRSDDFELLCLDGTRRPVSDFANCNWGKSPSNAIVMSSAKPMLERIKTQDFLKVVLMQVVYFLMHYYLLQLVADRYGEVPLNPVEFYMFNSTQYGQYDLMLSDDTKSLVKLPTAQQNFQAYLESSMAYIHLIRSCPVQRMILCVTSHPEYTKCLNMKAALDAKLLKPRMDCYNGKSNFNCMGAVKIGDADIAVFEAGDIYSAGLKFELVPIMAELYNLDTPEYYVVAVSKQADQTTDILYLRGKKTCHPGVMHGGGWVVPLSYLINNDFIRPYGQDSVYAASQYFAKSCAPGIVSPHYRNFDNSCYDTITRINLCHLCHGTGSDYCIRSHQEPYFGFTGAFRCVVEGGGDVAFVKHTTVLENTDGKKRDFWIRNQLAVDYELICRDGTRTGVTDYENCNMGKVKSSAVVTRGGYNYNITEIDAYINLLLYAQHFFGRHTDDEWNFQLFHTDEPYADLIFQDATQQLIYLEPEYHHYQSYLGRDFLRMRYTVDCDAGTGQLCFSSLLIFPSLFLSLWYSNSCLH